MIIFYTSDPNLFFTFYSFLLIDLSVKLEITNEIEKFYRMKNILFHHLVTVLKSVF